MNFYIICALLIFILLILVYVLDVNLKQLKEFIKLEEVKLNDLTQKYPENTIICKFFLKKLNNTNVKIEENKEANTSMYMVLTNKIIIANVKNSYTRIQTIAHECLHSIQPKKMLVFNFVFSNFYIWYFIIVTILLAFRIIYPSFIYIIVMCLLSYVHFFIRSYLENDAMIKAKYLAKEYMEEIKISTKEEINLIISSYSKLNDLGIKLTNYDLFFKTILKIFIMLCIIHILGGI